MTWSIIARDPETGRLGIAVTTKFFAVGALCAFGAGRVGVVATQAFVNPLYGHDGLRLLGEGRSPEEVLAILGAADPGTAIRQVHVLSADGRTARHTGASCVDWCGHAAAENVSVAGNMLSGPRVIEATLEAYLATSDLSFPDRLIAALDAGQAAGSDKRGRQSAALRIWDTESYAALDLRVDDHSEPLVELRRLHEVSYERWGAFLEALPTRVAPGGKPDRDWIDNRAAEIFAARQAVTKRS
jgi:uncharacterized Ntn-hydrolase superfamily protein